MEQVLKPITVSWWMVICWCSAHFIRKPHGSRAGHGKKSYHYGLASEIYVAESNEKGGTWYGVVDGLKKGRKIYVRKPEENEKNANEKLIGMGAVPVDFDGKAIECYSIPEIKAPLTIAKESEVKLPGNSKQPKMKSDPMQKGLFDE